MFGTLAKSASGGVWAFLCIRVAGLINLNSLDGLVFHSRHIGTYWWLRVRKFGKRQDIGSLLQDFAFTFVPDSNEQIFVCPEFKTGVLYVWKIIFSSRFPPIFHVFQFLFVRWIVFPYNRFLNMFVRERFFFLPIAALKMFLTMIFTSAVAFLKTSKSICLGCLRPLSIYSPRFHRKVCGKKPKTNWDKKERRPNTRSDDFFSSVHFCFWENQATECKLACFLFYSVGVKNK